MDFAGVVLAPIILVPGVGEVVLVGTAVVILASVIAYEVGQWIASNEADKIRKACEQWANNAVNNCKPGVAPVLKNWVTAYGECIRYGGPAGANRAYGVNY